ncbi:MAG: AMP-binding protein [Microbacterium gubbeenense]
MTRLTFSRILADRAAVDPDLEVVIDDHGTLTARELDRAATSLAHALVHRGVKPNDTVAVTLGNTVDFVVACAAVWRAGATPQPLSPELTGGEREKIERLGTPTAAIGARPETPGIAWLPSARVAPDARPLPDLAADCWKAPATSGSTGSPKIVRAAAPALLDPHQPVAAFLPHQATQIVAGPLWHSAVFTYAFRGLLTGHRLIIMNRFTPERWLDLVERHRASWGLLVPTMMSRLLRLPAEVRDPSRVASIERVLHMGAPCRPDLKRAFLDWLGPERVDEVYAGSESNGLTHITGTDWLAHPGSVGRGIGGTTLRIRDDDGADVAAGQTGTIWMHRGDASAYAYVGAESRRDELGWDSLADVGHLDQDGYLFVHDRAGDLINRGGDKIPPATIETVLEAHPAVLEAVAFGVPDDDLGEAVHAAVRLADPSATMEPLLAYAAQKLRSRAPVAIHPTTDALRNEAGKVRRTSLTARIARPDLLHPTTTNRRT